MITSSSCLLQIWGNHLGNHSKVSFQINRQFRKICNIFSRNDSFTMFTKMIKSHFLTVQAIYGRYIYLSLGDHHHVPCLGTQITERRGTLWYSNVQEMLWHLEIPSMQQIKKNEATFDWIYRVILNRWSCSNSILG